MHKTRYYLLLLPLILILAACSGGANTAGAADSGGATAGQGQNQPGQPPDMSKQPIEQRLAIGTLLLEGSDQAVTTEQAKTLLPLWKAVKAVSSDSNAAPQELSAVYTQIQEAMTAEQMQAIKGKNPTMEETRALMEKYGIQMPQNPGGELSESERATRVAQFQAERGSQSGGQNGSRGGGTGGFPGGMPPEGGGFPGGGAGMPGGGMPGGTQSTPRAQGTPQAGQAPRGIRGGGFNLMFVDPLIQLLTERAGT